MSQEVTSFYTYIYYDPTRGNEPFYVGKGKGNRAWSHLKRADHHPLTHRIQVIKKQGKMPIIGLYAGYDEEFALFLEEELISLFGRRDLGTGSLTNLSKGGESGLAGLSKETLLRRAANRKANGGYVISEKQRETARKQMTGTKWSEESRKKVSATRKGVKRPEETRKKIAANNKIQAAKRKGVPLSGDHRDHIGAGVSKSWSPERKAAQSERMSKMRREQEAKKQLNKLKGE